VNIIDADCAIVAAVDIDHVSYLGDNRESIGFEKAGIFRAGRPAICGDPDPPASLVRHAEEIGASLQVLGRDFGFQRQETQWDFLGKRGAKRALPFPALRGAFQLKNASSALAALDELRDRLPVSLGEVKRGLLLATIPGRLQVLPGRPSIVLDVAHNPQAARALAEGLGRHGLLREYVCRLRHPRRQGCRGRHRRDCGSNRSLVRRHPAQRARGVRGRCGEASGATGPRRPHARLRDRRIRLCCGASGGGVE
jgi:folylpolyglutamate synthase/dihydropteroate synthase